jgi:hypothetical protein
MQKEKVVPGIELGLPESESDVLTITLYNHFISATRFYNNIICRSNTQPTHVTDGSTTPLPCANI